jgi:hypothetical protein
MTTLTPPPPIPNRADPATFPDRADAYVAWWATVADEINNLPGLYTRENVVGTVSQTGGIPTGAIIERGSNSNGTFIKYADGTMICTHEMQNLGPVDTSMGVGSRSARHTWTYPVAFVVAPQITITANRNNVDPPAVNAALSGVFATTASYWLTYMGSTSITSFRAQLVAVGRWF